MAVNLNPVSYQSASASSSMTPIPDAYLCPITQDLMEDPVVAADGFTYERAAIEEWFQRRGARAISPKTGVVLAHRELISNTTLRTLIRDYVAERPLLQRAAQTQEDLLLAIRLFEEEHEAMLQKRSQPPSAPRRDEGDTASELSTLSVASQPREATDLLSPQVGIGILHQIRALSNDSPQGRHRAAYALGSLAKNNEANQNAIREAGGIPLLTRLLEDAVPKVRRWAAYALGNLAANNEANQNAIREAGAIPLLIPLLRVRGPTPEVRQRAACALGNLAANNKANQNAIREASGIPLLRGLLEDVDPRVRLEATEALKYVNKPGECLIQ